MPAKLSAGAFPSDISPGADDIDICGVEGLVGSVVDSDTHAVPTDEPLMPQVGAVGESRQGLRVMAAITLLSCNVCFWQFM
jgi:hypothetical protein